MRYNEIVEVCIEFRIEPVLQVKVDERKLTEPAKRDRTRRKGLSVKLVCRGRRSASIVTCSVTE